MGRKKLHLTEADWREARRLANRKYAAKLAALRPPKLTREERFWVKVAKSDGCWLWTRARNGAGYGVYQWPVNDKPRMQLAHRLAWRLTGHDLPDGVGVLHTCDNPPCVNPAHLFLGDQKVNMADAAAKDRMGHHGRPRPA